MAKRFSINFVGNMYSCELYNSQGDYVYNLEEAIEEAEKQFPDLKWEVYNGEEGYMNELLQAYFE